MAKMTSIQSSYLPVHFFKVSDQIATLWRKYLHRVSKWDETFPSSQVSQIISLHPNSDHLIDLCEHRSNSWFLSKFLVCEASIFYLAPLWLKIFPGLLLSIWYTSTRVWLISFSQYFPRMFPSFWTEEMLVKQVPIWQLHLVWPFCSVYIWPNHQDLPSGSPIQTPSECSFLICFLD